MPSLTSLIDGSQLPVHSCLTRTYQDESGPVLSVASRSHIPCGAFSSVVYSGISPGDTSICAKTCLGESRCNDHPAILALVVLHETQNGVGGSLVILDGDSCKE